MTLLPFPIHYLIKGYVVGFGKFIPEVYRHVVDHTHRNFTINDLKPSSEYVVSLRAFNNIGESKATFVVARTEGEAEPPRPLLMPKNLAVKSLTPRSLSLTWTDPVLTSEEKSSNDRHYVIRYSPISGESYLYTNTSKLELELEDLEPDTTYEVSVQAVGVGVGEGN